MSTPERMLDTEPGSMTEGQAEALARALIEAIRELPVGQQDAVLHRVAEVVLAAAAGTADPAETMRLVQGVLVTARLHRNPHYLKALAAADADVALDVRDAVDVHDFVAERRARRLA